MAKYFQQPAIEVMSDFENFFRDLVTGWMTEKHSFNHRLIVINAIIGFPHLVEYQSQNDIIVLRFYEGLRSGTISINGNDIEKIIALL